MLLMFFYQCQQSLYGLLLWDIALDDLCAAIEGDLARSCSDVAEIGICHLARTIHDATHYCDFQPVEVSRCCLYFCQSLLQVEECSAATGAGYVLDM